MANLQDMPSEVRLIIYKHYFNGQAYRLLPLTEPLKKTRKGQLEDANPHKGQNHRTESLGSISIFFVNRALRTDRCLQHAFASYSIFSLHDRFCRDRLASALPQYVHKLVRAIRFDGVLWHRLGKSYIRSAMHLFPGVQQVHINTTSQPTWLIRQLPDTELSTLVLHEQHLGISTEMICQYYTHRDHKMAKYVMRSWNVVIFWHIRFLVQSEEEISQCDAFVTTKDWVMRFQHAKFSFAEVKQFVPPGMK